MKNKKIFNFHKNEHENSHEFLAEELFVPRMNNTDTQRGQMFSNHVSQLVHLVKPEFPKVFTNFENQIGEYSIAYKKAKEDFIILKKIIKNPFNYDLLVQYKESGIYDLIHFRTGVTTTESYGYMLEDSIPEKKEGDEVKKGDFVYKSTNYDEDGNFSYGVNLKAVYGCWFGKTYEDGIVLSESAAKKLTSFKVDECSFAVNTNDILINLYGNDEEYKSFPKIGEHTKDNILVALRRKNKYSILHDFKSKRLREPDLTSDDVIYSCGGKVIDIDIFSNVTEEELSERKDEFSKEILEIYKNQNRYWKEIREATEQIIPLRKLSEEEKRNEIDNIGYFLDHPVPREENPKKYTDELAYYWKFSHEQLNSNVKWKQDGKVFDNFKMRFQILKENPVEPSVKLTGRYGNKGIVSMILPDDQMPVTEDGIRAEICLNALGVINRMNLSQIIEQHINFMSDHVLKFMKEKQTTKEKLDLYLEYISYLNKNQHKFMEKKIKNSTDEQKEEVLKDILENGIFVHQYPFFGNPEFEDFEKIFVEHPEWQTKYKFKGVEKPMVMGDVYFIRLKHEASNKSSFRSASNLNTKNLPSKSNVKRDKKSLYSSNPLKIGEMETNNLLLAKNGDVMEKLLKSYSTNQESRSELICTLLNPPTNDHGQEKNIFDMNINIHEPTSISREILEKFMNFLELEIDDDN